MANNLNLLDDGVIDYLTLGMFAIIFFIAVLVIMFLVVDPKDTDSSRSTNRNSNSNSTYSSRSSSKSKSKSSSKKYDRSSYDNSNNSNSNNNSNNNSNTYYKNRFRDNTVGPKQVFNISNNVFSYDDAEAACKAFGAELATYEQLVEAHKKGANWCNYGWTKGKGKYYPVQKEYWKKLQENTDPNRRNECGNKPGIVGGIETNKSLLLGVNCYGEKRAPRGTEVYKRKYISDKDRELNLKINEFRKGDFSLNPFNADDWNSCT